MSEQYASYNEAVKRGFINKRVKKAKNRKPTRISIPKEDGPPPF